MPIAEILLICIYLAAVFAILQFLTRSRPTRPQIICLCGSTRFHEEFQRVNCQLTLKGYIVLSIGCNTKDDDLFGGLEMEARQKIKDDLDFLHFEKIKMSDEVYIIDVGGYIGESTEREIAYAMKLGKPVLYHSNRGELWLK